MKSILRSNRIFKSPTIALVVFGLSAISVVSARRAAAENSLPMESAAVVDRIQDHYQHTQSFRAKFTEELSGTGRVKRTRSGPLIQHLPGPGALDAASTAEFFSKFGPE